MLMTSPLCLLPFMHVQSYSLVSSYYQLSKADLLIASYPTKICPNSHGFNKHKSEEWSLFFSPPTPHPGVATSVPLGSRHHPLLHPCPTAFSTQQSGGPEKVISNHARPLLKILHWFPITTIIKPELFFMASKVLHHVAWPLISSRLTHSLPCSLYFSQSSHNLPAAAAPPRPHLGLPSCKELK